MITDVLIAFLALLMCISSEASTPATEIYSLHRKQEVEAKEFFVK